MTFHLPTVDAWLLTEHAQQILRLLPHEERQLRLNAGGSGSYGVAARPETRPVQTATKAEG